MSDCKFPSGYCLNRDRIKELENVNATLKAKLALAFSEDDKLATMKKMVEEIRGLKAELAKHEVKVTVIDPDEVATLKAERDALREAGSALRKSAERMRYAANELWSANNPDDATAQGIAPLTVECAQETHSEAFQSLQRAEYYWGKADAAIDAARKPK